MYLVSLALLGCHREDGGSSSWISPPSLDTFEKAPGESGGARAGVVGTSDAPWHDGVGSSSLMRLWQLGASTSALSSRSPASLVQNQGVSSQVVVLLEQMIKT